MCSSKDAVLEALRQVSAEDVVDTLCEEINKSCQKIGGSLQPHGVGNIYWMKPTKSVLSEDKDLLIEQDYQNLQDSPEPDMLVRGIGLSREAELVRAARKGWIPFGFVLIQFTRKHGRALHVGVFEWAALIPGVDALMDKKVMELALA